MSKFKRVDKKLNSFCVLIRCYWWFFIFEVNMDLIHKKL